jgi:hypothetical protein
MNHATLVLEKVLLAGSILLSSLSAEYMRVYRVVNEIYYTILMAQSRFYKFISESTTLRIGGTKVMERSKSQTKTLKDLKELHPTSIARLWQSHSNFRPR